MKRRFGVAPLPMLVSLLAAALDFAACGGSGSSNWGAHRCADPMWPDRGKPGGEGYPPIGGPSDWWDEPETLAFEVTSIVM